MPAFQNLLGVLTPVLSLLIVLAAAKTADAQLEFALPNCDYHCGNLSIPYPFGLTEACSMNTDFSINCSTDGNQVVIAYWANSNIRVTNISVAEGEMQVAPLVARDCYDKEGNRTKRNIPNLTVPPFTISNTKNKFIAVGCDTYAIFKGFRGEKEFVTGCMSICNNLDTVDEGSCSGGGCCKTDIPTGLNSRRVTLSSYYNHVNVSEFNLCSYAFIVQEDQFNFSKTSFQELENVTRLPMVLNWAIGNQTVACDAAKKNPDFACKANNSKCLNAIDGFGYICQCLPGYQGNPYLPQGCQDIDECMSRPCNGTCVNVPGSYSCACPGGYTGDGMKNGTGCVIDNPLNKNNSNLVLILSLGIGVGIFVFVVGSSWPIYWGLKKRKFMKLKEKYFKENGGLVLQQQLASHGGSVETLKIFTAEGLAEATNNYHESGILGEGGYGTVYKGVLPDKNVVAIKKSKISAQSQSHQFVNEVIVLSQINHRNVVRLLGCCLETEMPVLVYEFITNGTLYEHIHKKKSPLTLELRMKIAAETAGALAYLHSSASMPIIHRDVKATNILLDENYTTKVSDFGASRMVALGETQIATLVLGTLGYLDPEYLQSNMLTEKSDVYSFGVVLVELLTSKVPLSKDGRCLASIFVSCMDEDCLIDQILDEEIVNEGNIETLKQVANLARRCLRVNGEERPAMKEVAMELEGMRLTANHPWGKKNGCFNPEETECLLGSPASSAYVVGVRDEGEGDGGCSIGTSIGYHESMQVQMLMPYDDDGR